MISRIDNENLYYMESDDVGIWDEARLLQVPEFPWQVVQIGNCGSPLETEAGWLLLTHGVGPMRQYCIGATLLDLDDPGASLARLASRSSCPMAESRSSGYVPNVVYSCGAMIHNRKLIIPYAISDLTTGAVRIDLDELLASLRPDSARIGRLDGHVSSIVRPGRRPGDDDGAVVRAPSRRRSRSASSQTSSRGRSENA